MTDMDALSGRDLVAIIKAMADAVQDQRDYLAALDSMIGDGDHGANIVRAMTAASTQVAALESPTPAVVLRTTGRTIINEMGGAAGVIFGSFFRGGGRAVVDYERIDVHGLSMIMDAGLAEVQKRGGAKPGGKTMVDALVPAVQAMHAAAAANLPIAEAVRAAAESAKAGAEATTGMIARFGRAKYLGERSLGYQDAGATSVAIMLAAWAREIED